MQRLKFLPLILAMLSMVLFAISMLKYENHLENSRTVYIDLAPVDPRSLLQGDYMALNYNLNLIDKDNSAHYLEKHSVLSYIQLDAQQRMTHMAFGPKVLPVGEYYPLKLKNPSKNLSSLYPAANSFMFAEGLESCYREAKFAELKVDQQGQAMLAGLVDENLKSLACESQKKWHEG